MSSSKVSLWLGLILVVSVFASASVAALDAGAIYRSNLSKIDSAVFNPSAQTTPAAGATSASTGTSSAMPAATSNPNTAGFTVAVVKLKDMASSAWASRGHDYVVSSLQDIAARTQDSIVQLVYQRGGLVLNRLWLTNSILVATDATTLRDIAQYSIVEKIHANYAISLPPEPAAHAEPAQGPYEWNIEKVRAPDAWALGITGAGVRVCVTDTGFDVTHPDVGPRLFTTNPSDPYYPGGWMEFDGSGNPVSSTPYDSWIHGTHVSGTIAGDSLGGTAIGVAPGVSLMESLVLPGGGGTFVQVVAGMQWCVNPFDQNGDPTGYPAHVQSMSWGAVGLYPELLDPTKNSLLANVLLVGATGNEGEGSIRTPGAIWGVFGAGATDVNDNIADFSSGMVVDWPNPPTDWPFFNMYPASYIKPDFSAPGVNVKSTVPGGYDYLSGTSMATPHISATVALMIQASGFSLTPEQAYNNLINSVVDFGAPGQDTRFGYGRIDTFKAVLLSLIANTGVKGTVYDSVSSAPLQDVRVTAEELGAYTSTNASGTFKMGLPEGMYNISFRKFGYFTQTVQVDVKAYNGTINGYVTDLSSAPIDGAAVTFVEANLTVFTDINGYYTASVKNGTYNVIASAAGFIDSTQSVIVPENDTAWANFTLAPNIPAILTGTVYNGTSGPIAGALVWAEGPAKYQGVTDGSGVYTISISGPDAGDYVVAAFAGGYWPEIWSVTVVPGTTTVQDFVDSPSDPTGVAIYQDWQGQLAALFSTAGYLAYDYPMPDAIDLKWSLSAFPVVYWSGFSSDNDTTYPTADTFLDILAIAQSVGTSIVFADSYNGWPYGIELLSLYTGDPLTKYFDYNQGNVYFHIMMDHPIFAGVGSFGDTVYVINQTSTDDGDHTWFSGYTGDLLAHVGTPIFGNQGDGVANRTMAGGTQWVLLGSLAPQFWTNLANDWTANAMQIADNAVAFGQANSWVLGMGTRAVADIRSSAAADKGSSSSAPGIRPLAYIDLTIYLEQMPSGFVAGTVTDTGGAPVADVRVYAEGTPVEGFTDVAGQYSIELPIGTWTIVAKKFGYQTGTGIVDVLDGQTTTLDFILVPQRRVGIMYDDSGNPIQQALDSTGKFAIMQYAGNWDELIADTAGLDLVVLSARPFESVEPSAQQFNDLLAAADASGAGIVFLDSVYGYNSPYTYAAPYGISLLVKYLGDPANRLEAGFCYGALYQDVTAKHGITRGYDVGDRPVINSNTCTPISWFEGFSGTTVGRLWSGYGTPSYSWGDNLAYKVTAAGTRWALMSAYAPVFGYGTGWTADGKQFLINAAIWASTQPMQLTISPQSGPVATSVDFTGSGAPANAALTVNFDQTTVGTTNADGAGAFAGSLTVPEAIFGGHSVVVMTLDEGYAGEQTFSVEASIDLTPTSGPPNAAVSVAGHGYPANVFVDLDFASIPSGKALTAMDGSFSTMLIAPNVRGGDYAITGLHFDSGASASAMFRVIEQVALTVTASAGTLHFPGEVVSFYILVTAQGTLSAATVDADLWLPSGTSVSLTTMEVAVGVYKATYTLPGAAPTGTYALVAQASVSKTYLTGQGAGLATFLVSPTLTAQNALITSMDGMIAQIQTDTGAILLDLAAVNAELTSIEGTLATISTSIGTLTANVAALDAKVTAIQGSLATVQTSLGTIQTRLTNLDATVTSIDGNVATLQTSLGTIQTSLNSLDAKITDIQGGVASLKTTAGDTSQQVSSLQTTGGLAASSMATVAAIFSVIAAVVGLMSWRASRKPKEET